jgi:hypothetical protein
MTMAATDGERADSGGVVWRETTYGFVWGGLEFQRLFSDERGVVARIGGIGTDDYVEVVVSPKGRSVRAISRGVKVKDGA